MFWIQSCSLTPSSLTSLLIWPQRVCDFSFQSTKLDTVGKKQEKVCWWGKGSFEKTLVLLFSQSPLLSPEDERAQREGAAQWERKQDDPCHPPNPKSKNCKRLCFPYTILCIVQIHFSFASCGSLYTEHLLGIIVDLHRLLHWKVN